MAHCGVLFSLQIYRSLNREPLILQTFYSCCSDKLQKFQFYCKSYHHTQIKSHGNMVTSLMYPHSTRQFNLKKYSFISSINQVTYEKKKHIEN